MSDAAPDRPLPGTTAAHWLILVTIAGLVILADQVTKAYVVAHLARGESWMPVDFIEPYFRITHVRNSGAAFGIFPGGGQVFLIIAAVISLAILYFYRQLPRGVWLVRAALGLQLGGALGNVIDRVRQAYVVDFFHVPGFPVFNVADSCISIGVALLAFVMLREEWRAHRDASRAGPARSSSGENTPVA